MIAPPPDIQRRMIEEDNAKWMAVKMDLGPSLEFECAMCGLLVALPFIIALIWWLW